MEKLEKAFEKLMCCESNSLLKKYLTPEIFHDLKKKTTSLGATLGDCINSGLENLDSGIGIYAADAESYSVFEDIFNPIINEYHGGFTKCNRHPESDWGDLMSLGDLDPENEYIVSTRIRCGRTLAGYPFHPCMKIEQYCEIEKKISETLSGLSGEFEGKYKTLCKMDECEIQKMVDDHYLFKQGDKFLEAAKATQFWPNGRGIFHNECKTFICWVNEEDHLRVISMQCGGDVGAVYTRLVNAMKEMEARMSFNKDERLGNLTFCPTNLGTTIRASVLIKLPKLVESGKLEEVAKARKLQVRGTEGEHSESKDGSFDISNKRRLGVTEYEAVKEMYDGVAALIKMEKALSIEKSKSKK